MTAPFHIARIEWTAQEVDSTAAQPTPYDSVWSQTGIPAQESTGIERQLLKEDKLYAVLAVVLIIWLGIALFLIRTDRKLDRLERQVDNKGTSTRNRSEQPPTIE
jgi:CcmD family protein